MTNLKKSHCLILALLLSCALDAASPLPVPIPLPDSERCSRAITAIVESTKKGRTNRLVKMLALMKGTQSEKCAVWEQFVTEIRTKQKRFKGTRTDLADGSVAYVGHVGETLLIDPKGTVYLLNTKSIRGPLENWGPDYSTLTSLRSRYSKLSEKTVLPFEQYNEVK